ncbi:MAG: exonuclease SbcCD subunit D C-terminal domain-containing protein [Clostridia bacterium]|nr:exonuclease SbcCD subunit D C-terminal domain-containing protein [Clostridia bacterium]
MKLVKVLISVLLVATMCVTMMMPASAGRVTYYLSDLKMAEANTADEAKNMLTDAGYEILDKNLNPGGSKVVYLGYKKSTNVDDAITDVKVMNMKGGFNVSDYETIFEDALDEYNSDINNLRIAANEFAANYKAGKKEAQLAYRQLNYYYVENDKGVKTNMGDYMLNFPSDNKDFADILLKGNPNILDNIRILLSMGVSDGGDLIERITAATKNEDVYTKVKYHDDAEEIAGKIQQLKKMLSDAKTEIDEINADTEMTEAEKDAALIMPQYIVTLLLSFDVALETIPCGDTNYSDYFETTEDVDYKLLYPFVDAMTAGQRAMAVSGQIHSVLVYNAVEMSDEELNAQLAETEKDYEPLSVYLGTDMNLLEGAVGVTSDALREEAATGNNWFACFTGNMAGDITISSLFGVGGIALMGISAHFLKQQYAIATTKLTNLENYTLWYNNNEIAVRLDQLKSGAISQESYDEAISGFVRENNEINAKITVSTSKVVLSSIGVAVGVAMIAFSIYSIVQIVDKYNPSYTKIPSNMVDTVATDNGSRYINYTVVNSLYYDGDKTAEKPGDTNAYDGKQWNAIYYTKSYEAGKCMTSTGYFIDSADNFGKYTPVAAFGTKSCYDLNSFNDNENTENIFVAFGNSNNKKSAETSVPTVIGSMLSYGAMAVSGVVGMGLGMCVMSLIKRKKES